jgi:hypothetical protein
MSFGTKIEKIATFFIFKARMLSTRPPKKTVFFHISSINPNRRLLQIVSQFSQCGYACYLDIPFKKYLRSDASGRAAVLLKYVYPAKKGKPYDIVVSDRQEILDAHGDAALKIFFNLHIFEFLDDIKKDDLFYPITMYRKFLSPSLADAVYKTAGRESGRKIAALFIGNVDDKYYNNEQTKKFFGIYTRYEIFSFISSAFKEELYAPPSYKDFLKKIDSGFLKDKIVLINTNNFEVPSDAWFDILLETDFFIHMCGFIQPYCHNQIESMLAGCVPVTQFNRFFVPRFEQEKDALLFETKEELRKELEKIVSGAYEGIIRSMRRNILSYYRDYYSGQSFKEKISSLLENGVGQTSYHIVSSEGNNFFAAGGGTLS